MKAGVATAVLAAFLVLAVVLGLLAARGRDSGAGTGLAHWSLGGRSMGPLLSWVLLAGEGYTSFSYLGAAGWGYAYGVPVLYVVAYMSCGFAVLHLVGPLLWKYAHTHHLIGMSDIVAHRYRRPWLGAVVAVTATVFMLPYIQLQIMGMGVVVSTVTYGAVSINWSYAVAFVVSTAFIIGSGLRGSAWVSVLKDALVIGTLLFLAAYLPWHYFDGFGGLFEQVAADYAQWLTLPGHGAGADGRGELGVTWFVTTVVVNSLVLMVFPSTVAGLLAARDADVVRLNTTWLPFYNLLLFVPMLLGMTALFVVPGLTGTETDQALLRLVVDGLPAWVVGIVGVAAALSALVPMAVFMLVIGTMWGRSVLPLLFRTISDTRQHQSAKAVVLVTGAVALAATYLAPSTLVRLSLVSCEAMAQLLPLVVLGLLWRGLHFTAGVSGLVVGALFVFILVSTGNDPLAGVNAGLIGLAANLLTVLAVTASRKATQRHDDDDRPDSEVLAWTRNVSI
ncbi:sodium:solute symporter family protein [Streptomyces sp. NBC_01264]|uniref:sodium:solute symporter family protein n=1 Tax=Streptomyces sp. NBC_01264 TaxID=2903804 RepID=UPI00224CF4D9|nr:sodium:solute symporter family protein [Streptomyces sp. NBC_01264]MCX4784349.1 sodium:solute symporter family protein [Streptomyces sp. NBC_01264]